MRYARGAGDGLYPLHPVGDIHAPLPQLRLLLGALVLVALPTVTRVLSPVDLNPRVSCLHRLGRRTGGRLLRAGAVEGGPSRSRGRPVPLLLRITPSSTSQGLHTPVVETPGGPTGRHCTVGVSEDVGSYSTLGHLQGSGLSTPVWEELSDGRRGGVDRGPPDSRTGHRPHTARGEASPVSPS